tara:strand:- start:656 stop:1126 length:471 start_codon:yes stop_codon:yes gene_type:complete
MMAARLTQTVRQLSVNIVNNNKSKFRVINFTRGFYFIRAFTDGLTLTLETVMILVGLGASKVARMTKSELIARLAEQNPSLYHRDLEQLVNTVFETITKALEDGDRVELRGFGAFSIRERKARMGRNPRTGESVNVEAKRMPFFKMGKGMRERLNK